MRAFQRPSEATLNPRALLFAFSPFPAGAEGDEHELPRNRGHRSSKPASFAPRYEHGAKLSRNKQRREHRDPPSGDGCAARMNNMDVGRLGRPSPPLLSGGHMAAKPVLKGRERESSP